MRIILLRLAVTLVVSVVVAPLAAQQPAIVTVPREMWISNVFRPANGLPPDPVESVTLAIYAEENGGAPLWQETQNVTLGPGGRYTVLLGASSPEGLPLELFTAAEKRWLGILFNHPGESEQPRMRLASVPYALSAANAETLGGRPASAYVLAEPNASQPVTSPRSKASTNATPGASAPVAGQGWIPVAVDNAGGLGDSTMFQSGGYIGVGTTAPVDTMHVSFTDGGGGVTGYAVQNKSGGAGAYSGMLFYDQTGVLGQFQGFNNSTHEYRINNIASSGSINFMISSSSKFLVANSGNIGISTPSPAYRLDVNGDINISTGSALRYNTGRILHFTGTNNLFLGGGAGNAITSGGNNTALGQSALASTTTGSFNTATGFQALAAITTGQGNTAAGYTALAANVTGLGNTAVGNAALSANTGSTNTAVGSLALTANTTASDNTAAGYSALTANTTGASNTAMGRGALSTNTTGSTSTALGALALAANTTASGNTAAGYQALTANTTGFGNTAIGNAALAANTTANVNTALGSLALTANTTGTDNTAVGYSALSTNLTGFGNTAMGRFALNANTGDRNTAVGALALSAHTTGPGNTGAGYQALTANTTGLGNTAIGNAALSANTTGSTNTALGSLALSANTTGGGNTAIGYSAGINLTVGDSNDLEIGNAGVSGDSGTIRVGTAGTQTSFFAAGVRGVTTANNDAVAVLIDSAGQLGTASSSRRFKEDIHDMGEASRALLQLRPVTFRYKQPFVDGSKPVQYGLIAEEVAEVYPDLVAHSADGQIETVKYQVLDVLLLNEVQRQQSEISAQRDQISVQQNQIRAQREQMRRLEERLATLEAALARR